ncbi:MAG TPA: SCO family protein [Sandaracinaceae bacterium LLY-WYZ-13_1]|nr:SCO family protein [Sandaracinaceae bacterium LLY-WYZ-13_1]
MGRSSTAASALALGCALLAAPAAAQDDGDGERLSDAPPGLENVGVDEQLDEPVPTDVTFRDHTGERVRLGDYLDGERPVLLNLVYHTCPSFCSMVLDGTVNALKRQGWTVGVEFDVVTISIDPRDTPEVAADKRRRILYQYGREEAQDGWHFLVAERSLTEDQLVAEYGVYPSIERLAEAIGFRYQWMPRQRQYAHPGVIMLLTPEGRVARYLYGLEYESNDIRLGLLEASRGNSISTVEQVVLYCYRYDPSAQGYTLVAWRVMQVGGALTALLVIGFLLFLWRRETRKKHPDDESSEANESGLASGAQARG